MLSHVFLGHGVVVTHFEYLGHIIDSCLLDDADIDKEIKNLFTRANLLIRKFSRCLGDVKFKLFKAYCLCFYDISLWSK